MRYLLFLFFTYHYFVSSKKAGAPSEADERIRSMFLNYVESHLNVR